MKIGVEKSCKRCGEAFSGGSPKRLYCFQEKNRRCSICEKPFSVICQSKDRAMSKTCGPECQHLLAEKTRQGLRDSGNYAPMARGYSIAGRNFASRNCEGCGDSYIPTMPTQRFCRKQTTSICGFCQKEFHPRRPCDSVVQLFCSTLCGNLDHTGSKIPIDRLEDFKAIDKWALAFYEKEGRKPNSVDVMISFNAKIPGRANRRYFDLSNSRSFFEEVVFAEIAKSVPLTTEIRREKQPLRSANGDRFELDLWLPTLKLAFEVQDFATHSKDRDDEPCSEKFGGGSKKGPRYHELKRELARTQINTKLVDIWEDEILDGSFQLSVRSAIEVALNKVRYDSHDENDH